MFLLKIFLISSLLIYQTFSQTLNLTGMNATQILALLDYSKYGYGVDPNFIANCGSNSSPNQNTDCTSKSNSQFNCCFGAGTAYGITRKQCFALNVNQTSGVISNLTTILNYIQATSVSLQCTNNTDRIFPILSILVMLFLLLI